MAMTDVLMPKMGESITEGTVIAWHKKVGDTVELDEILLEIGTDKVDTEIPAASAGVVSEILVEEGATVEVGTLIARIRTGAVETEPAPPPPARSKTPDASGATVQAVRPATGEGTITAWHKKVDDTVALDETSLETGVDEADSEVPSPAAGMLAEVLVPEGETVDAGRPQASSPAPAAEPSTRHLDDGRFLTPLVRAIAQKESITARELESISGSGSRGRINKQDILDYVEARKRKHEKSPAKPASPPVPALPRPSPIGLREEVVEMDRLRQLVAHHMTLSRKTAAHVTSFAEVDATNLVRLRQANKQVFFDRDGIKLTYTPFLVYAAVEALRDHPMLNASVDGTRIILKKDFHIGIAVNIRKTGLVVPVIKHAERQRVAGLAHAAHELAERARSNNLQPDDLQGGTFTLTNLGSLGSIMGTPIILQPQVAILATGAIQKRPVVIEDPILGDVIAIRQMMNLSLSYDHRIIDGAMGISFLRKFAEVIENLDPAAEV